MARWQGRLWAAGTVVTLLVLTFALGVPPTLRWIVQKFWKVLVGVGTGLALMSWGPLSGTPGMVGARDGLLTVTVLGFGLLFGGVFTFISRRAWANAWQTYLWERTKVTDQLDG